MKGNLFTLICFCIALQHGTAQPVHILNSKWKEYDQYWVPVKQEWRTYNPYDSLNSVLEQSWITDRWVDVTRTIYVYNEDSQLRLFQYDAWDGASWHPYTRFTYTYDEADRTTSLVTEDWVGDNWINRNQKLISYTTSPASTSIIKQVWINGEWINHARDIDYLDANARITEKTHEEWSNENWCFISRELYNYDGQELVHNIVWQEREGYAWDDEFKTVFEYDFQGNITRQEVNWLNPYCHEHDYLWSNQFNETNHILESALMVETNDDWQYQSRVVFDYDKADRLSSSTIQQYADHWYKQELIQYTYADAIDPEHDYSDALYVSPNPVNSELKIVIPKAFLNGGSCAIYAPDGRIYATQSFTDSPEIYFDVNALPQGSYILKVFDQSSKAAVQFVKE